MGEAFKELGKHLLNLALIVIGAFLIQPFAKGVFSFKLFLLGLIFYLPLVVIGFLLIFFGNKLNSKED